MKTSYLFNSLQSLCKKYDITTYTLNEWVSIYNVTIVENKEYAIIDENILIPLKTIKQFRVCTEVET